MFLSKTIFKSTRFLLNRSNNILNSSSGNTIRLLSNRFYSLNSSNETETTTNIGEEKPADNIKSIPYQLLSIKKDQWEGTIGKQPLPKNLLDQFTLINKERTTILRKPVFECIDWLQAMKEKSFMKESQSDYFKLLDGYRGSGKSTTLTQLIFWATQQNWLVLYISSSNTFINSGTLSSNDIDPLRFSQNEVSYKFLNQFLELNSEKLQSIPLKTKFKINENQFESSSELTLYDLLSKNYFDCASEVFYHFKRELDACTEFPVLVAIDGYNSFLRTSDFGDMYDPRSNYRTLPVERLLVPSLFKNIKNHSMVNGVVVAATSSERPKDEIYNQFSNDDIIEIPKYSLYETKLFVNHLVESGFLSKFPPQESIQYLWQMASGNPGEIWKLLRIYS